MRDHWMLWKVLGETFLEMHVGLKSKERKAEQVPLPNDLLCVEELRLQSRVQWVKRGTETSSTSAVIQTLEDMAD